MQAASLLIRAKARGVMIATAESCTGGLIAGAITDVPGSSVIFDRGFVTYSNAAKVELLGVKPATLEAYGAVSEEVAAEMAAGALAASDAQIAISVTGLAGPGGTTTKPEGLVCFGLSTAERTRTEAQEFGAIGRAHVRTATVFHSLEMLLGALDHFSVRN